jgi:hypothetical protein
LSWQLPWLAVFLLFFVAGLVPAGLPGWSQDRLTTAYGKGREATASAVVKVVNSVVWLVAPLLAGLVLIAHNAVAVLVGITACYVLSALLSRIAPGLATPDRTSASQSHKPRRAGRRFAGLYLLAIAVIVPVGALEQTVALILRTLLDTESRAGIMLSVFGFGSVVGALVSSRIAQLGRYVGWTFLACVVVAFTAVPILDGQWHVVFGYAFALLLGVASSVAMVAINTHAAEVADSVERGAVFSMLYACAGIGYFIAASISSVIGVAGPVWVLTVLVAGLLGATGWIVLVRNGSGGDASEATEVTAGRTEVFEQTAD